MGSPVAVAFRTIVFIGLTYSIIKQIDRYMKNKDSPFFSFKRFLDTPLDPYPVFTFVSRKELVYTMENTF